MAHAGCWQRQPSNTKANERKPKRSRSAQHFTNVAKPGVAVAYPSCRLSQHHFYPLTFALPYAAFLYDTVCLYESGCLLGLAGPLYIQAFFEDAEGEAPGETSLSLS